MTTAGDPNIEVVPPSVEFCGERFALAGAPSEFAMMEFAQAAEDGQDGETMAGMASMLRLVRDVVAAEDWPRFRNAARSNRADTEALMAVVQSAFAVVAERPTGRPVDSSPGPSPTPARSVLSAEQRATARWPGRPDLQRAFLASAG